MADAVPVHDLGAVCGQSLRIQGGLVTRAQLRGSLADSQIRGLVRRRRLVPVTPGVYRVADQEVPQEQPAWAAVLATGGRLTGEHLFALLGIEGGGLDGPPTVLVPPGTRPPKGTEVRLVHGTCGPGDQRSVRGIPALAVPRAVVEHASEHPLRDVLRVVDSARWSNELTTQALLRCAAVQAPAHLGGQKIRWMNEAAMFVDESPGERTLGKALGTLGLLFRHQAEDVVPGRRFDRYCDLARLALEYDGREGERDLDRDAAKDLVAAAHHVLVLHITKTMVRPGCLRETVGRIAAQVEERARTRPWPSPSH